jgi:hypothetical protein
MEYLHKPTDCVVQQKVGLFLSVNIVSHNTSSCHTTQFSLISVGLCKKPFKKTNGQECLVNARRI